VVDGENDKAMKWKAFAVWFAVLFLSAIVGPKAIDRFYGHADSLTEYNLFVLSFIGAICIGLAAIGTAVVWVLPVRRVWLGIVGGIIAGAASIALAAWFAMTFYGGFENDIGILLATISLGPGSCLAGAYAGFSRSRENRAVGRRRFS
jgi:MFS family permease